MIRKKDDLLVLKRGHLCLQQQKLLRVTATGALFSGEKLLKKKSMFVVICVPFTKPGLPLCLKPCLSLKLIIILQLLGAIISLDGASDMSICSWFIPALWRHPLSVHTMDNNRRFMEAQDGCEVSSLYMAGIPGTLIHLQSSKVRARWLLRSIKLRAVTWRLSLRSWTH